MTQEALVNLDDLRRLARRKLPRIAFDFIEGGVDDEIGLERNRAALPDPARRPGNPNRSGHWIQASWSASRIPPPRYPNAYPELETRSISPGGIPGPESRTVTTMRPSRASLVTTIDATRRRLVVIVPRQLPSGRAAVSVTNTATGGVASGVSIDVLELFTPQPAAAPPGATGLRVTLTASSNTNFVAGATVQPAAAQSFTGRWQASMPTRDEVDAFMTAKKL